MVLWCRSRLCCTRSCTSCSPTRLFASAVWSRTCSSQSTLWARTRRHSRTSSSAASIRTRRPARCVSCTLVLGKDLIESNKQEGIDFDSPRNVTSERQIFYCVPVPGETQWASDEYSAQCVVATPAAATTNSTGGTKRPLNDDGEETDDADAMMEESQSSASSKRVRAGQQGQHEANVRVVFSSQGDVKHPLSNDSQPPCVVKVCDASWLL